MRRAFAVAAVCAAVLLSAAPVALAWSAPPHPVGHTVVMERPELRLRLAGAASGYVPLARRLLIGTGTIALNVYDYEGQPEPGAQVGWFVGGPSDYGFGSGSTDAAGHVELAGVPAAADDNGELTVFLDNSEHTVYDLQGLSWGEGGWTGGLQPGRLHIALWRSSDKNWNGWRTAQVSLWTTNGPQTHVAQTDFSGSDGWIGGYARTITTGAETLSGGTVYFWDDEGTELPVSGAQVSPGVTYGTSTSVLESGAQRVWMDFWGSGKPGTRTWLVMNNFRNGWTSEVTGIADWPSTADPRTLGKSTSTGDKYTAMRVTIPASTAPGYKYWVAVDHEQGSLSLVTSFQTCTLKPSRSTIGPGASVSLHGVVPVKGHRGGTKGTQKYVTVYRTTSARTARSQPRYAGGKTVKGWTRVARVRSDRLGRYHTGSQHPTRTTWYVAWYPRDSWYWGAWTSVARVRVK